MDGTEEPKLYSEICEIACKIIEALDSFEYGIEKFTKEEVRKN
jgi:hypothetical protein